MFDDLDYEKESILPEDLERKLKKYGIYESAVDVFSKDRGLIDLELDDLANTIRNKEIVLLADDTISDDNIRISFRRYVDAEPTDCVLNITASNNITLGKVDEIIESVKRFGSNVNTVFGIRIDDKIKPGQIKVLAILTREENPSDQVVEEEIEYIAPKPKTVLRFANPDDRSLFDVAKIMLEKDITAVNALQVETNFGFNKASKVFSDLENLGIISKRENGKRRFLITDINEIYSIICDHDNYVSKDELNAKIYAMGQYILATKDTSVNGIINRFGYTFNEATQYISILEDRKVITEKNENGQRRVIVNNIHELYECVYNSK